MAGVSPSSAGRPLRSETRLIRQGVAWNSIGLALSKGSSILAKLILARILVPEYFGFVSMVLVFTLIARIIADLGLRETLIHRRRDRMTRLVYDSAFWLLMLAAAGVIMLMWLLGVPFLVWFYGEPRLETIAVVMSFSVLFQNLQVIPEVRLARAMRFRHIASAEITGTLVGCAAAILLALLGAGVWALVAQTLVTSAAIATGMFLRSGWRPHFRMKRAALLNLRDYSGFIVGSRALVNAQQNLDYLLIGKLIGAHAVGIYSIAFLLTETLRAQIGLLAAKVVFPAFSRTLGRKDDVRAIYLGTVRYMALAIFPAGMLLILFADTLVPTLFTPKWIAAVVPIQILAVASMVVASSGTPGQLLRGIGRPDLDFRINLAVTFLVALPALWAGIVWLGLPGAALAILSQQCVAWIAYQLALRRLIHLSLHQLLRTLGPALVGAGLMALAKLLLGGTHWLLAAAVALALYGAAAYPTLRPFLKSLASKWRSGSPADHSLVEVSHEPVGGLPHQTREPTISVVIPTCDRPRLLADAIASVLVQTLRPIEIIVVDNGVKPARLADLPAAVTLHRIAARAGPSRARNVGAQKARGDYIAFLDDDDWWDADFLREAWQELVRAGVRSVYGQLRSASDGNVTAYKSAADDPPTISKLLRRNPGTGGQNLLIERSLFLEIGGFDEQLRLPEDRALALEVLLAGERIGAAPKAIAVVRRHSSDRLRNRQLPKLGFVWKYRRFYSPWGFTVSAARILLLASLGRLAGRIKDHTQGRASCVSQ